MGFAGGAAFAVTPGSATLTLSSAATGATGVTATNTFTTNNALASGGTIYVDSLATNGSALALPAESGTSIASGTTGNHYTVTYTPSGGSATAVSGTVTSTASEARVTTSTAIPSGASVTVAVAGITNPSQSSTVYFSDDTSADSGAAVDTGVVSISPASVAAATVAAVNPSAYTDAAGEPFTIFGTNFSSANSTQVSPTPVVCFVQSGTAAPAPNGPANPCPSGSSTTVVPGTVADSTSSEIQGTAPALIGGQTYNVVVYNFDATSLAYTAASATSAQSLVAASSGLNVVPESGVRVVDSRIGESAPRGTLSTSNPVAISLSDFFQSQQIPTNVPSTATGLYLNVTAVAPATAGNLEMWIPAGSGSAAPTCTGTNPGTATVNFQPPQDTNNAQLIAIPAGVSAATGIVCVQDNGAAASLVVDVDGYTTGDFAAAQKRILDTRSATGGLLGPLSSGTVYRFDSGLAAGTEVALNVAAVAPTSDGYVTVYPETTSTPTAAQAPTTAVDNFIPATDASAMLITTIGQNGYLDIYSGGSGKYNLVIDELGTFTSGTSLHPVAQPYRIYDSRPGPLAAGQTATVLGAPTGSGSDYTAPGSLGLVGNLSDISPAAQGYLVSFPAGEAVPGTASIADYPSRTRNTNNMVALNPSNGSFSIYAGGANTNTTFDVSAYIK